MNIYINLYNKNKIQQNNGNLFKKGGGGCRHSIFVDITIVYDNSFP